MGKPLSLLFDPLEVLILFLSVLLVRFATEDGRTHYMRYVSNASKEFTGLPCYFMHSGIALLGTCKPLSLSLYELLLTLFIFLMV
jgi:hypothetical protein